MKAIQTQATSPKVNSPCQRCPVGKWRSRIWATFRRCSVANRTGMSSTRSTRCTCGDSVFIPSLVCADAFLKTPNNLTRTAGHVGLDHVFHAPDVVGIGVRRDAPRLDDPRLDVVFF